MYKPQNYNSLSPYLIVDNAQQLSTQLQLVFDAQELRKITTESGGIRHLEIKIIDSILMLSDSTADYPAFSSILHCYVPDVFATYERAMECGCIEIDKPIQKNGEEDIRGNFYDCGGNYWSISTQAK